MSGGGTRLAGGFPDLSGLPAARRLHGGRWLAAALILLALAALARAFAQGQIEWAYVGRFLTVPAILDGIGNTVVMAVLAMALGIVLGVVVAVMRVTLNDKWRDFFRVMWRRSPACCVPPRPRRR